ncbi:MAG: hydroxymethylglutaryl-CoA lyase [Phycisphaerales bacterium]
MPERVRITDVAPRDGLQSEPRPIPTEDKASLIEIIARTGVDEIEATSFVSPRWIPQLGDAHDLFTLLKHRDIPESVTLSALVPNQKGMEEVYRVNAEEESLAVAKIAVFTAASETFSKRNTNASIEETLERFAPVVKMAHEAPGGSMPVRGYVSCAVKCPYDGDVAPSRVADVARRLIQIGVDEIDLGDTIGAGTPDTIARVISVVRDAIGEGPTITLHLHDTFGRAADCVRAALREGVRSFDAASAGLGGCPYASTPHRRAPGNIALATLIDVVHAEGYETGTDADAVRAAGEAATKLLETEASA